MGLENLALPSVLLRHERARYGLGCAADILQKYKEWALFGSDRIAFGSDGILRLVCASLRTLTNPGIVPLSAKNNKHSKLVPIAKKIQGI